MKQNEFDFEKLGMESLEMNYVIDEIEERKYQELQLLEEQMKMM